MIVAGKESRFYLAPHKSGNYFIFLYVDEGKRSYSGAESGRVQKRKKNTTIICMTSVAPFLRLNIECDSLQKACNHVHSIIRAIKEQWTQGN